MSICLSCAQGFHDECGNPCCCSRTDNSSRAVDENNSGKPVSTGQRDGMVWSKADSAIKDLKSTGRKRAAKIYPLDREADCEWRNLRFAGGGLFPIPGCVSGLQQHRHHGPILLTTANIEGNVHRICTDCHNRWHGLNDAFVKEYMQTSLWTPHDPTTTMTVEEIVKVNAIGWTEYARQRVAPKSYKKSEHEYVEYLEELKVKGLEVVNSFLGY